MRRALISLAVGVAVGALLLTGALLLLDSGAGRRYLERTVNSALSGSVRIEGLGEGLPGALRLAHVELLDRDGVWAEARDVRVDWSPRALLRRVAAIDSLRVGEAVVHRAPLPAETTEPATESGDLPVAIRLEKADIAELRLEAGAPGGPARFAVEGSARVPRDLLEAELDLAAQRLDAPGRMTAKLAREGDSYRIDAKLDEPEGGVLAQLLALGEAPAISLSLEGSGPLEDFDLRFQGAAGEARASGEATLRRAEAGLAFEARAAGAFGAFLPEKFRPLAAPQVELTASGTVADDGAARLDAFEAHSGALAVQGSGALDAERRLAGQVSASGQVDVLARAVDLAASGAWRLEATLGGSLDAPSAEWRLAVERPQVIDYAAEALSASGTVAVADRTARLQARAEATNPVAPGAPLPASLVAELEATADLETSAATLERASVAGGPYALSAQGHLAPDLALELTASASTLEAFGLQGAVEASGSLAGAPGALRGALNGRFAGLQLGQPQLDAALGPKPGFAVELRQDGETLRIARLEAEGANAKLTGSGALADGRVQAEATLALPALAPLGSPVGGQAQLKAEISGALDDLSGPVSLAVQTKDAQLTAKGQARVDAKSFALADLRLEGTGLTGQGALSVPRAGGAPQGRLTAKVADLRPWAALVDAPAEGAAEIEVSLAGEALQATLRGRSVAWGEAVAAGSLQASADLKNVLSAPAGPVKFSARDVSLGGTALREIALDGRLSGQQAEFKLRAEAPAALDAPLQAAGRVDWSKGQRQTLASLRTAARGQEIRLARPATIVLDGPEIALDDLDLRVGAGRLAGQARLGAQKVSGQLTAKRFPLAPFLGDAAGTLEGEVRLSGAANAPQGELDLRLTPARDGLPPELAKLALEVEGRWRDGRLALTAQAAGAPGAEIKADLALPLQADFAARQFAVPPQGGLKGELRAAADIGKLSTLLPLDGVRLGGRLDGALTLGGTVASPDLAGQAALVGGTYDDRALGTRIRDLRLRLRGDGRRVALEDLSGTDGAGGTISGSGAVALEQGEVRADVNFANFRAANTDEIQALASGELRLAGPLDGPKLAGTVTVEEAEIAIPRRLPSQIATLEVQEINLPPGMEGKAPEPKKDGDGESAFELRLDVSVKAPGQVFVRGRGLDSEWRGDVHIGGTLADPQVTGALNVVRGQFDLAGNRLELQSGSVTFPEGRRVKVEPQLDIVAATQADDLLAELRIFGPVSDIKIELSSQPAMPSDEILSRLLFGKSAGELTAAQAFQLGQTALALSGRGGSGGLLANVRKRFGLDFLDVESGDGSGLDAARLSAGKYLRDDVYVGVKQGAQAGSSSAVIEYEFLPNLSLEGSVGANSEAGVGLNWEKRY